MIRANVDIDLPDDAQPWFKPGQLVRHKRYGYRGVVVAVDQTCQASEAWYQSNKTQPDRNQPWYHVLVDLSESTTYPAQSSLQPDESREPITHPLTQYFFSSFVDGRYIRNSRPWPTGT
jgi:heat shock protein HspQ